MNDITIRELQRTIGGIDHKNHAVDQYFYKLTEEVGELAQVIRKNQRMGAGGIKNTIEEELYDVLYYVVCLANQYGIDLTECAVLKEELNAEKYKRGSMFEKN